MASPYNKQLGNALTFTFTISPGTTSTDGGAIIGTLLLYCSRPVVRAEVVNADAAKALTCTWQYQAHPDSTWVTLPAAAGNQPATVAAATTTQLLLNVEAMYAVRLRAYLASGGTGAVTFRGTCSDKPPGSVYNVSADIGDVHILDTDGTKIDPATKTGQTDVQALLAKATADTASTLYNGGGTANALQLEADSAAVVAGGAAVIDLDGKNAIDIQLVGAAASESCTLLLTEYSAATPTVINQIRQVEVEIPTTDLAAEVDLQMVGLATATGYAKSPVRVVVTPGAYLIISLAAESAAGAKYCRHQLHGSV